MNKKILNESNDMPDSELGSMNRNKSRFGVFESSMTIKQELNGLDGNSVRGDSKRRNKKRRRKTKKSNLKK